MSAAWANVVSAMPCGAFAEDLGRAVSNDGSAEGGARWFMAFASDFLRQQGEDAASPWRAYDLFIGDWEALQGIWPAFRQSAQGQPIEASATLPALARFIVERLPNVWQGQHGRAVAPITLSLAVADRIDSVVGMFAAGLKPNGSKDPFALRRAARELLEVIVFPVRRLGKAA